MAVDYDVEVFGPGQFDGYVNRCAEAHEDLSATTHARRRWWCFDNPHGGSFAIVRAGTVIAANSYMSGKRLRLRNVDLDAFEIGETGTRPEHRRKGLFSRLVRASEAFSVDHGDGRIYGTPNRQSTPGYAKLGYAIVEGDASWLVLSPNLTYFLRLTLPLPSGSICEIDLEDYIASTKNFARLNVSDAQYLFWRLNPEPMGFRFFRLVSGRQHFFCAARPGTLGRYPVIVVAEYFYDGRRPDASVARRLLRRVLSRSFDMSQYLGIYFHAAQPAGGRIRQALSRVMAHRQLPICAKGFQGDLTAADWFADFQLSDCDIG